LGTSLWLNFSPVWALCLSPIRVSHRKLLSVYTSSPRFRSVVFPTGCRRDPSPRLTLLNLHSYYVPIALAATQSLPVFTNGSFYKVNNIFSSVHGDCHNISIQVQACTTLDPWSFTQEMEFLLLSKNIYVTYKSKAFCLMEITELFFRTTYT